MPTPESLLSNRYHTPRPVRGLKNETIAIRGLSTVGRLVLVVLDEPTEGFVPWVGPIGGENFVKRSAEFFERGGTKRPSRRLFPG
jgi:hypothetical protein